MCVPNFDLINIRLELVQASSLFEYIGLAAEKRDLKTCANSEDPGQPVQSGQDFHCNFTTI